MKTDNLKTNHLSQEGFSWLKNAYGVIDGLQEDSNRLLYAEDSEVVFGNRPAVSGRENVINMFKHFWSTINTYEHSLLAVFGNDDSFAVESVVTYTRLDDKIVNIPAVTIIERNLEKEIKSMRIYLDIAPLHQN
jgi:hypothetical protein